LLKLYFELTKSLSLIIVIGYLISQNSGMQVFLRNKKQNIPNEIVLGILFGLLAILGTYFGKPYKGGIANLRDTGVIIAGLFAGPVSGGIAGFIGGIHRYYLGGITALPCSLATMINGLVSGYFYYLKRDEIFPILPGILLTLTLETFHINLVMLLTTPRSVGIDIGRFLYGPMVLMNSLGVGLFLYMLRINLETAQKETALTAQRVLNIASKTFPILSKESKENAFQLTANLIHSNTNLDSVIFTDKTKILGIAGNLNSELSVGEKINDSIIKKAVENGKAYKYYYKNYSALTVPLKNSGEETIGSLVLYRKNRNTITDLDIKLARGMSLILSTQIELKEIEMEKTLRLMAQFNELQSRINPHFLFNSLNTINHILRIDPSKARNLIIELSTLPRKAVSLLSAKGGAGKSWLVLQLA
jgi:LytS/YehU family sensor histidine kinase